MPPRAKATPATPDEKPAAAPEVKEPEASEVPALADETALATSGADAANETVKTEPVFHNGGASTELPKDDPSPGVAQDTGMVDEPCRRCFPDGWPAHEEGAFVNCPHGFGIRYGDQVEITRERAVELGFLDDEE